MIPKMEFPRPDRQRGDWLNLNGQWEFKLLPDGVGSDAPEGFDRQITVPFSWVSPLSGMAPAGKSIAASKIASPRILLSRSVPPFFP